MLERLWQGRSLRLPQTRKGAGLVIVQLIIQELRDKGDAMHLVDLEEIEPIIRAVVKEFPQYHLSLSSHKEKHLLIVYLSKE
jgi:hypothetical protein